MSLWEPSARGATLTSQVLSAAKGEMFNSTTSPRSPVRRAATGEFDSAASDNPIMAVTSQEARILHGPVLKPISVALPVAFLECIPQDEMSPVDEEEEAPRQMAGAPKAAESVNSAFNPARRPSITSGSSARRPSITSGSSQESRSRRDFRSGSMGSCPSTVHDRINQRFFGSSHSTFRNLWNFLDEPESSSMAGKLAMAMMICTVTSVIMTTWLCIDSGVFSGDRAPIVVEIMFDAIFTVELTLRFIVCPSHATFCLSFYNLIDLLASVPGLIFRSYICVYDDGRYSDTSRAFSFFCVPVRLLKLLRRFEKFHLLLDAFSIALEALPVLLFTLTIIIMSFSAIIYNVEPRDNIHTLPEAIFFIIVTMTTVGYGNVVPQSSAGHILTSLLMVGSALYMAIPLGIVGNAFSKVWGDRDRLLVVKRMRYRLLNAGFTACDMPELFHWFDKDNDGEITYEEFKWMMDQMNIGISGARLYQLFLELDEDGKGTIDDGEFVRGLWPKAYADIYSNLEAMDSAGQEADGSQLSSLDKC